MVLTVQFNPLKLQIINTLFLQKSAEIKKKKIYYNCDTDTCIYNIIDLPIYATVLLLFELYNMYPYDNA